VLIGLVDQADADRAAEVLDTLPGVELIERTGDGLIVDLDGTSRARALETLVAAGIGVDQLTPRRHLEEAFLALVGES
jgi:ABC-2 type transport system ATP-binding protein